MHNRNAFPGLCSREVKRKLPASSSASKRQKTIIPFTLKETWTHDFVILGSTNQDVTPSRDEMEILFSAGLGRRRLVCPDKNASHEQFQAFLESEFPRLKGGGGFEVLRGSGGGGGQRKLLLIPLGPYGYTVPYLKGVVGSGLVYIRPLQADLDLSLLTTDVRYLIPTVITLFIGRMTRN